jgi:hypothetical protein
MCCWFTENSVACPPLHAAWVLSSVRCALAAVEQVLFNIIYDLLGTKLTWHALCPVIDSMNHSSASQVSKMM